MKLLYEIKNNIYIKCDATYLFRKKEMKKIYISPTIGRDPPSCS